jgi:hypothetical protein
MNVKTRGKIWQNSPPPQESTSPPARSIASHKGSADRTKSSAVAASTSSTAHTSATISRRESAGRSASESRSMVKRYVGLLHPSSSAALRILRLCGQETHFGSSACSDSQQFGAIVHSTSFIERVSERRSGQPSILASGRPGSPTMTTPALGRPGLCQFTGSAWRSLARRPYLRARSATGSRRGGVQGTCGPAWVERSPGSYRSDFLFAEHPVPLAPAPLASSGAVSLLRRGEP